MVNKNEIRIGNAYLITPFAEKDVVILDEKLIELLDIFNNYDRLKPIPLNEDWLVKFGFIEKGEYFVLNKDGFALGIRKEDFFIPYVPHTRIEYVHQLQNLYFALTGEELKTASPSPLKD